jgi:hypothetical protein
MAKGKFERKKPHVNVGTIGHVRPEERRARKERPSKLRNEGPQKR